MQKAILSGLILVGSVLAQAPGPKLEFEVASVRPAGPPSPGEVAGMLGGPGSTDPEHVRFRNATLQNLLLRAFAVQPARLSAPAWLPTTRFDISANLPAGTTTEQFAIMLQNLLIDRFKITSHTEKRDFPVYDMVVAKGGVKMNSSTAEPPAPAARGPIEADPAKVGAIAAAQLAQIQASVGRVDKDGFPALPDGNTASQRTVGRNGQTRTNARGQTMEEIATILQRGSGLGAGARVIDKTGLTGRYDFKLKYSTAGAGAAPNSAAVDVDAEESLPDLPTAVQEQLGLKLEKSTELLDVLVIDHIEKTPADN